MQMQYRETRPPGGDVNQVRAKIFPEATRDCEAIAKAVGRKCVINNINFSNGFLGAQTNQAQGRRSTRMPTPRSLPNRPLNDAPMKRRFAYAAVSPKA